jgi:hypothetical protein
VAVAVAAALAATVAVVGVVGALGDGGGDGGGVETDGDRPEARPDRSSSTRPDGETGTDPAGTASTTAVPSPATSTTLAPGEPAALPGTPMPGNPAPGGGSAPATPGGPAPTTVAAPDTTPPDVSGLARSDADISVASGSELCAYVTTSLASAAVSDPSGIQSVTLSWSGAGPSGSAPMLLSGGTWRAEIGPVAPGELGGATDTLDWSVEAVDTAGNVATSGGGPAVTVHDC